MRQVGLDDNSIHELPVPLGLSHSGPLQNIICGLRYWC